MTKPLVFCYKDYTDLKDKYTDLLYKFARLKDEKTNLEIKCRILETDSTNERMQNEINALQAHNRKLIKESKAIVRCKDCRYFKKIVERSDGGLCHRDIVASAWKENGYCSRGERREP